MTGRLLGLILTAVACLSVASCRQPDTQDIFVHASEAVDGVYHYGFELKDSLSTYDFSFYARSAHARMDNLELRVQWISPSGKTMRETVYMQEVTKDGSRELYRSGVVPVEYGAWRITVRPVDDTGSLTGLGVICKNNFNGTR